MKSNLFTTNAVRADERSALLYAYSTMSVTQATALAHPRLVGVHPPQQAYEAAAAGELPPLRALTQMSLTTDGAYLMEDGQWITMWLGK